MNIINRNRITLHGSDLHCCRVNEAMTLVEYQGGSYTVLDESHPLYSVEWDNFLLMYENNLFYAIKEELGDDVVVRLYNVTDDSGDFINEPSSSIPGWIVMDMKDLEVDAEDNSFLQWRYNNSGLNKTMNFRVNQVEILPNISSNIVGQIFWLTMDTPGVIVNADGDAIDYAAGLYMCEYSRYVRLDFDADSPELTTKQVKEMHIIGESPNRKLALFAYAYTDPDTEQVVEWDGDITNEKAIISQVDAEDWFKHIDINISEATTKNFTGTFIPSDLSSIDLTSAVERDQYGHVTVYKMLKGVNLRYRWEEV